MLIQEIKTDLTSFESYLLFKDEPYSFFLDSGRDPDSLGRYSFIGGDPLLVFTSKDNDITIKTKTETKTVTGDPFDELQKLLKQYKMDYSSPFPFIGGAVGAAWNMFGLEAVPATPLRVLLTLIVGAVGLLFLVFALRILAKRLFHARYYLYLGDRWLVERNFWHATIIPVSRLEYAWGRREFRTRGADLEYESIAWKGADGTLRVYDLKDHYWHGKGHGHAAVTSWTLIRRQYGIGGPPASLAGARRTLTLEED